MCKSYEKSYGKLMVPLELNIIEGIRGKGIYLCKKRSLKLGRLARNYALMKNHDYYSIGLSKKTKLKFLSLKIFKKLKFI